MIRPAARCSVCCSRPELLFNLRHVKRRAVSIAAAAQHARSPSQAAEASRWRDFFTTARRKTAFISAKILPAEALNGRESLQQPSSSSRGQQQQPAPVASTSHLTLDQLGIVPSSLSTSELIHTQGWRATTFAHPLKQQLKIYMELSKSRLSALVVLTAMAGYAICPVHVDPASTAAATEAFLAAMGGSGLPQSLPPATTPQNILSLPVFVWTSLGTALCSAAANTFNQISEVPLDAQMNRTRNRVLVRRAITPLHAATFGLTAGLSGVALLYHFVNPLTASLGLTNIALYAALYTPLKRIHIVNTWVGSLVGAIPPLMGWTACTNSLDLSNASLGAWGLVALMFAWQFPTLQLSCPFAST